MTITKNIGAKAAVAFVAVAMAFTLVAPSAKAQDVSSMSLEQLIALVNQLQAQVSGSGSASGTCSYTFTRSLSQGSTGADVMNLQKFLNMSSDTMVAASGAGSAGMETSYYGPATAAAVSKFQTKYSADILVPSGLTSPTGYFGPATMAKANALCAAGGSTGGTGSTGGLKGGAGTLDEVQFISALNNEEVGEGQEDVDVAGLEITPDNSDIAITAVKLTFDHAEGSEVSGSATRLSKYADEVSLWLDGEEVARLDADDFTKDSTGVYSKTVSVENAVIRDGDKGELVVAVSGVSNLDSGDVEEEWGVKFANVRYQDAQGAYTTDSSTGNLNTYRTFSFEDFATSAAMEFKVRSGDTDVNNARTIAVSSTTKTSDVKALSFKVEIDGDSDMNLDEMTVDATTTNATLINVVSAAYLYMDGDRVGSESITSGFSSAAEITFNDLDLDLEAGETYEFEVRVDLLKATGDFASGTTLDVDVSSADVDNTSKWVLEDENGDTVAAADRSGSASADAHTLVTIGGGIALGSKSVTQVTDSNDSAKNYGQYTVEVEITAIADDIYVLQTAASSSVALTSSGVQYIFEDSSNAQAVTASTTSASLTYKSGGTVDGSSIRIDEGQTATFELVATFNPTTAGQYGLRVTGIGFGTTNSGTGSSQTASPASDFRTSKVYINN
jgi:hypothetical protein